MLLYRHKQQMPQFADEFDLELFGLIRNCADPALHDKRWLAVAEQLRAARTTVRSMMDEARRTETPSAP